VITSVVAWPYHLVPDRRDTRLVSPMARRAAMDLAAARAAFGALTASAGRYRQPESG
jgi:hypothetical protein